MIFNFIVIFSFHLTSQISSRPPNEFIPLPALETGIESVAMDVSANGSVVVGQSTSSSGYRAIRWTRQTGSVDLGVLPGDDSSGAAGVSPDGNTVVGRSITSAGIVLHAFRWTRNSNVMERLLEADHNFGMKVSAIGSIVGQFEHDRSPLQSGWEAYRWLNGAFTPLGVLPNGPYYNSVGLGVSADGKTVVGRSTSEVTPGWAAAIWSPSGSMGLGSFLPQGLTYFSQAFAVSPDAKYVVGEASYPYQDRHAFRWSPSEGLLDLGALPPMNTYEWSTAYDLSADGRIVVGKSLISEQPTFTFRAFIWDRCNQMRDLKTVLQNDYRLNLGSWILTSANAISEDGLTIAGEGFNPAGFRQGWIAKIKERPRCRSDFDRNGLVDFQDLYAFLEHYKSTGVDFNEDGVANVSDYLDFKSAWELASMIKAAPSISKDAPIANLPRKESIDPLRIEASLQP